MSDERTRAVLAAVAVGKVYRRAGEGDLLYTPADSIRIDADMAYLEQAGMAECADDLFWTVTKDGAAWLADCAVAEVKA